MRYVKKILRFIARWINLGVAIPLAVIGACVVSQRIDPFLEPHRVEGILILLVALHFLDRAKGG